MTLLDCVSSHQVLSILGLLLLFAYAYHVLLVTPDPSEPPLIKGYIPFLGVAPQALPSLPSYLTACKRKHGEIFTLYALGQRITIVTDPIDGVPAVYRKSKQLSFKAGLRNVYIKVLGFSEKRTDEEEMNKEHFQMLPPYLLATSAVDELTGRFIRRLLIDLRAEIDKTAEFEEGRTVDLFEWSSAVLFYSSASALWGEGIFDGEKAALEDFRTFDETFHFRLILPTWMTKSIANARDRVRDVMGQKFEDGLKNPSGFALKRIEIQEKYGYSLNSTGRDAFPITFALMANTMGILFWYMAFILSSEKHYKITMERIKTYVLPNAEVASENLFDVSALLADPFLLACFQETLRLRSQNGSIRIVNEATTIPVGGKEYHLRKGSVVFVLAPLIHMDTEIYSDVDEFHPERFLDADLESTVITSENAVDMTFEKKSGPPKFFKHGVPVKHYLMPFGGGDNLCTGRRFAQNEVIAMAATLFYLFEFGNPSGGQIVEPVKPAGKRYAVAAEGPGKPYMIKMRPRNH